MQKCCDHVYCHGITTLTVVKNYFKTELSFVCNKFLFLILMNNGVSYKYQLFVLVIIPLVPLPSPPWDVVVTTEPNTHASFLISPIEIITGRFLNVILLQQIPYPCFNDCIIYLRNFLYRFQKLC